MASLIDDLLNPLHLPENTVSVSIVQTHISLVFVADEFVYKIKKPVNFGFLDFSTLDKREYYCTQEINLNRRLSRDIYIEVLPVRFDGGHYEIGRGPGETVDYAVKMKRIPEHRLMKSLFQKGQLEETHLFGISEILSDFHMNALKTPEIEEFGKPGKFRINTDENFEQVRKYVGLSIDADIFNSLEEWTVSFYEENGRLFAERIKKGKIRDCHGDLHMEHICLTEPISVFDCIEFNDRFRYSDTVADIAFLLMDLEYHGGVEYSETLWSKYKELTGESEVESLLTFYKIYRAFVRGKVNSFQLDDENIDSEDKEKAVQTAKKYFDLAYSYLE